MSVERSALNVERSASTAAVDAANPWPGLAAFTEDQRGFFFGREKETDELVRLVRRQTLTVLFGQSGLGKSSLLQAGLFPLLRASDHLPLYLRLDHDAASLPLADQVKAALVEAFKGAGADAPAPRADLYSFQTTARPSSHRRHFRKIKSRFGGCRMGPRWLAIPHLWPMLGTHWLLLRT